MSSKKYFASSHRSQVLSDDYLAREGMTMDDVVSLSARVMTGSPKGKLQICLTIDPPPLEKFPELNAKAVRAGIFFQNG